jgi:hypothetical protein
MHPPATKQEQGQNNSWLMLKLQQASTLVGFLSSLLLVAMY